VTFPPTCHRDDRTYDQVQQKEDKVVPGATEKTIQLGG